MKSIRKGVFETNSSSMHSLAIIGADRMNQNGFYTTIDKDGSEKIFTESGEYGWGYETLSTPMNKLSYVVTMIQYKDDEIEDSKYFKWLSEMVKDYTGYELKYIPNNPSGSSWDRDGYIDHQSTDTLDDIWSNDENEFKNNMRDVIFNDKYFVIVDNDNH